MLMVFMILTIFLDTRGNTLSQSKDTLLEFRSDSFEAESVAFIWALYWTPLQEPRLQYAHSIDIVFDSMSAICISTGKWSADSPRRISRIAQAIWECVTHMYYIDVSHVKSHTGNLLNEFVDSNCTSISRRQLSCIHVNPDVDLVQHIDALK